MNDEKQRTSIAEACGWYEDDNESSVCWTRDELTYCEPIEALPDYLNDLNAWQPIERDLSQDNRECYQRTLIRISCCPYEAIHATAAMRAEAFLKTLNLWNKDEI